MSRRSRW